MKISRFNIAINKLYGAYTSGKLNPDSVTHCVVGTICDHSPVWSFMIDNHRNPQLNTLGKLHQNFGKRFNGYTPSELLKIESAFLNGCDYHNLIGKDKRNIYKNSDVIFNGLIAVISFLCQLEEINDITTINKTIQFFTAQTYETNNIT